MKLRNGIHTKATTGVFPQRKSRTPQTNFQLEGFWLHLARGAWISFLLVELLVLILSLGAMHGQSYSICPITVSCAVTSSFGSSAAALVDCPY